MQFLTRHHPGKPVTTPCCSLTSILLGIWTVLSKITHKTFAYLVKSASTDVANVQITDENRMMLGGEGSIVDSRWRVCSWLRQQ
jgi:hypothetical protein